MNIENVEKLLGKLAKSGDKETIKTLISLLEEIYSHKTPERKFTKRTEEERTASKPKPVQESMSPSARANSILDGGPMAAYSPAAPVNMSIDNFVKTNYDNTPLFENFSQRQNHTPQPAPRTFGLSNDVGMQSHADHLL